MGKAAKVPLLSSGAWDLGGAAAAESSSSSASAISASDSEREDFLRGAAELEEEGGAEKKDVMLLSAFGFLAAEASPVALRFREAADMVFRSAGLVSQEWCWSL